MHRVHLASKKTMTHILENASNYWKTKFLLIFGTTRHLTDPKILEFSTRHIYPVHPWPANNICVIIYLNKFKHLVLWINVLWIASLFTSWVSLITSIHPSILTRWYPPWPWTLHLSDNCGWRHTGRGITDGYIARRIRSSIYTTDWTARIREAVCPCKKPNLQTISLWNQILSYTTSNKAVTCNNDSK